VFIADMSQGRVDGSPTRRALADMATRWESAPFTAQVCAAWCTTSRRSQRKRAESTRPRSTRGCLRWCCRPSRT